jgi:hypothetical protein
MAGSSRTSRSDDKRAAAGPANTRYRSRNPPADDNNPTRENTPTEENNNLDDIVEGGEESDGDSQSEGKGTHESPRTTPGLSHASGPGSMIQLTYRQQDTTAKEPHTRPEAVTHGSRGVTGPAQTNTQPDSRTAPSNLEPMARDKPRGEDRLRQAADELAARIAASALDGKNFDELVTRLEKIQAILNPSTPGTAPDSTLRGTATGADEEKRRDKADERLRKAKPPVLSTVTQTKFDQWIKEVENDFILLNYQFDSELRSRWILKGIHDTILKALVRAKIEKGNPRWEDLKRLIQNHIQDPTIRKLSLAQTFWNAPIQTGDVFSTFVAYTESIGNNMSPKLFTNADGTEQTDLRISWYYSKLPAHIRKELGRARTMDGITRFQDFASEIARVETYVGAAGDPQSKRQVTSKDTPSERKRNHSGSNADQRTFKRPHQSRGTPGPRSNQGSADADQDRPGEDSGTSRKQTGEKTGATKKEHWKNKPRRSEEGTGKDKP